MGNNTPFSHRLPVKIVSWCLFVGCTLMLMIGVLTLVLSIDDEWFGYEPDDFYSSGFTRNHLMQLDWRIYNTIVGADEGGEIMKLGPENGFVNVLYAVYDENGKLVVETVNGERAQLIMSQRYGDYGYAESNYSIDYYLRSPLQPGDGYMEAQQIYAFLQSNCVAIFALAGISVLLMLACLIVLLCGAGRKAGVEDAALSWFNRKFPLDLHLCLCAALGSLLVLLAVEGAEELLFYHERWIFSALGLALGIASTCAFAAMLLHFLVCLTARFKGGKWWRCTIVFHVLHWCWRMLKKLFVRSNLVFRHLPLIWRSVLIFCGAALVNIILSWCMVLGRRGIFALFLLLAFDFMLLAGVAYLAIQLRRLQKGGEALAAGDLNYKIGTEGMFWDLKKHAENLNSISEGMNRAVNERMQSERFKTELITNVSHDIKTPLTSIINYVDLLKKQPPGGEETAEYLEVLERQSARLKKLTEDLVEASKASSGVLNVQLAPTDVCELLRQAAGEYDHRISAAQLQTVITTPERQVDIMCDGKLLWRVFDNLLSNICKYSQPGTRAYLSVDEDDERAWIMVKNISREVLNIKAEELMERFVRGDRSRSTEGSGLGLSIARSLTELQGGTFRLFVDGDLFKVIITFPKVN